MVRRAILDRGEMLAAEDQALPPSQLPTELVQQPGRPWRGAGGRWLVWAGRAVAWAVLLLIGYRGVVAIVAGRESGTAPAPASVSSTGSATGFPVSLAEAFALQFGDAYLNFSPADASVRGKELSRFLAPGADPQLGWNGAGTQRVQAESVADISVTSAHSAVVTLLASLDDGRMIELGVPIYAVPGGMSVTRPPALLPAPVRAVPPVASASSDPATEAALQSQLPAFFAAYASGDRTTLARFTTPDSHIRSLAGAFTFGGVDGVLAPPGGATRTIIATVTWILPPPNASSRSVASAPATLQAAYELTVIRQGASWDVQSIGAVPTSAGPP
jgi:Conjugative transposon protein TcpC